MKLGILVVCALASPWLLTEAHARKPLSPIVMWPDTVEAMERWRLPKLNEYIVHNAQIYPMDTPTNIGYYEAMVVQRGVILAIGNNVQQLIDRFGFPLYDLEGSTVIPGLTDSHVHFIQEGLTLLNVNLMYSESEEEVVSRIQAYAVDNGIEDGDWILGRGWDNTRFPNSGAWPTADLLDRAFPNNPIWLTRVDGHAGWANSAAMALTEIPDSDPPGGQIIRDTSGRPIGIFVDNAMAIVVEVTPPPTLEEKFNGVLQAITKAHSLGLTGVHDASRPPQEDVELYVELADQGLLQLRTYLMLNGMSPDAQRLYCGTPNPPVWHDYRQRLTVKAVKISMDGALGSRGAALFRDYDDEEGNNGFFLWPENDFKDAVHLWTNCGFQVNVHGIGDRTNRLALNVFEEVLRANATTRRLRNRIEHAQILTSSDIPRFLQLGVLPSMQPTHCTSDMRFATDRIGEDRIQYAYIWKTFFDSGVQVPFGSDFPVEEVSPFLGLFAAVTRQDHDGFPAGGFYPAERVSIYEAVLGFTSMAAYGSHDESRYGTLEVGKRADFLVLRDNIMEIADRDPWVILKEGLLQATVFDGSCVFEDDEAYVSLCAL